MRASFLLGSALPTATALVACTSLLGDFEVAPVSDVGVEGGPGGGTEGGADVVAPVVDASADGEAGSLPPLRCQPAGAPTRLDTTQNGISFLEPIRVFRAGNQSRAIAVKKGVRGFFVYTFGQGATQVNTVRPLDQTFEAKVLDVQPIPNGIGVLTFESPPGQFLPRFYVHKILDSGVGAAPDILTVTVSGAPASATFAAFGDGDYFLAATYDGAANTPSEVRIARRKPADGPATLFTAATGESGGETRIRDVVRAAGAAYLFNDRGPEQNRPGAAGYFRVSDDPVATSGVKATPLSRSGGRPVVSFSAQGAPAAAIRLAVAEVDFQGGTARLRAGGLGPADLTPIDVSKLPVAYDLASFFDAPVQGGDARWFGTDFAAVGTPLDGKGLNFFWYDAANGSMRSALLGGQKLIADRSPTHSSIVARQLLGELADFDTVWAEALDANGSATLWTQQIVCAR